MKKIFSVFLAGVAFLSLVSCADDYKELNQNPSNVTATKPEGLLTAAINEFQPCGYLVWYNNVTYLTKWSQMAGGAYDDSYTSMGGCGDQGGQYIATLKYRNRIKNHIETTGETKYNGYLAATNLLTIYLGIFDTDVYGSIPYTEACHYDDLGIVTPNYDNMETLYNTWLSEIDECLTLLSGSDLDANPKQDPAYGADWTKWAKLANSLKLKIAVRLYNNDPQKATQLAQAAVAAGVITDTKDDFLFCKATQVSTGNSDYQYGTGNGITSVVASDKVLNFMLGAKDPRVRFIYTKNGFNSRVVQSFIDNGKYEDLPTPVKENVILDENGNFKAWGGMGEPWVRYTAQPIVYSPEYSSEQGIISKEYYEEYFKPGLRYQIKMSDDNVKSYSPFSYYSTEMRKGRDGYTIPTAMEVKDDGTIDMHVIQDNDPHALWTMYLSAGEVNLYLAEFALLNGGSFGGKTAEAWYEAGVRASVEEFNTLASKNQIPYYGTTYNYDPFEKKIDLEDGEIDAMLATDNVKLTGTTSEKLEKVYLQLLMHFSEQPDDQFVTARRSGYPKVGSTLLPFVEFTGHIALSAIPRRFVISDPLDTDLMRDIKRAAYAEQGYKTFGQNSMGAEFNSGNAPLNVERVWADKNAPQWGTPKN